MFDPGTLVPLTLLGSYHLDNPGRDVFNARVDDVRSPQRQEEIAAVVRGLRAFAPTKVALEIEPERQEELDADYAAYRAGAFAPPSNERQQIGFRLAAALGHERVYAIDRKVSSDVDVFAYAEAHQPEIYASMMDWGQRLVADIQAHVASESVGAVLRWLNSPEELARNHQMYLRMARVGEGTNYVGIDWVAGWFERNLKIFAHLARITTPADRMLVVFGVGHIPLLTQFARDSGLYAVEPVANYLP